MSLSYIKQSRAYFINKELLVFTHIDVVILPLHFCLELLILFINFAAYVDYHGQPVILSGSLDTNKIL